MTDSVDQNSDKCQSETSTSPGSVQNVNSENVEEKLTEIIEDKVTPEEKPTEEIDGSKFSLVLKTYIDCQNVNFGEIDDIYGLYAVADGASKILGGVPDSILKEGMRIFLLNQLRSLDNGWMRNHLMRLETQWKLEMAKEKNTQRDTMVTMEAKPIHPFHENRKRRRQNKNPKYGQSVMGVSSLLAHARSKLALPNGEQHDIVETESGIEVGGEPLTFESWARMNSGPESDVIALPAKKRNFDNRVQLQPSVIEYAPEPAPAEAPPQPIPEEAEQPVKQKKSKRPKPKSKRARRVSEEGEISTSSESESATSDSDDDDDDFNPQNKARRTVVRAQQRANVANTAAMALKKRLQTLFHHRFDMVCHMTVSQKSELLQSLRMVYGDHDEAMQKNENLAKFLCE
uniref:DUF4476 domain-containing protein n=1 Tax=Panagrellus redivivus TaxID=6233 RepID=A0A7E4W3W8_PANRE